MRRTLYLLAIAVPCLVFAQAGFERDYDLKHIAWRLSFDKETGTIHGVATNTIEPLEEGFKRIRLNFGEAMDITAISVNGKPRTWSRVGEIVTVPLNAEIGPGYEVDVRIEYHGQPEAGVYYVPAERAWPAATGMWFTQGEAIETRYWIPTYDSPDDTATSEAYIVVEPGEFALGNGRLIEVIKREDSWTYHWKMSKPHPTYLLSFVKGQYDKGHEVWDGIPVDYYVPDGLLELGAASFEGTADMVRFYSELTGFRYPFEKFSQTVAADFVTGGMENITMVINTITTLHLPEEEPLASSTGLVLHELAHQWFGDTITNKTFAHLWINEGFASFLPNFYYREIGQVDQYHLGRYGALTSNQDQSHPVVWTEWEHPDEMFSGLSYSGGEARLFMLMNKVGEERFWASVDDVLTQYAHQPIDTDQFFDVFERSTGVELDQFEMQWFHYPTDANISIVREGDELVARQDGVNFHLDIPVGFLVDGEWVMRTIELRHDEARLEIPAGAGDAPILIDPKVTLAIDYQELPEDWSDEEVVAIWNSAPNAATKARILSRVRQIDQDAYIALFETEDSELIQERMVAGIDDENVDYLLELSRHDNDEIAMAALRRLPTNGDDERVEQRYQLIMESHPNPRMRAEALERLYALTGRESLLDLAWATPMTNEDLREFALTQWAELDPEEGRQLALEQLRNPVSEPVRVTAIRILGGLGDEDGSREVFNALVKVVQERSWGARRAALAALAQYGDPAALEYIEPLTDHAARPMAIAAQRAAARLRPSLLNWRPFRPRVLNRLSPHIPSPPEGDGTFNAPAKIKSVRVPFNDIVAGYREVQDKADANMREVLESGHYVKGKFAEELETRIAEHHGVKHGVACNSGTDALKMLLQIAGVGPGDEVITTSFTFVASVEAICQLGARPVFVDIEPETFNIDPSGIEAAVSSATKAILPVHLYGQLADMEAIQKIAQEHGLTIVEDAAQAVYAHHNDRYAGDYGMGAGISFYVTKNLGAAGDGGLVLTNDEEVARRVKSLREHGMGRERYYYDELGYTSRMAELQAAFLCAKLDRLNDWTERRREIADKYRVLLQGMPVELPLEGPGSYHVYHQFAIRSDRRDELIVRLREDEIDSAVFYPVPIHLHAPYAEYGGGPGSLPETERAAGEVLCLPIQPHLSDEQVAHVCQSIGDFCHATASSG